MIQFVKKIIKYVLPSSIFNKILEIRLKFSIKKAKRIFKQASESPAWLEKDMLDTLQQKYSSPKLDCQYYDILNMEKRGYKRAEEIIGMIPGDNRAIVNFLELGCWDGMACCFLQRMGKNTTAIDHNAEGFSENAIREGVRCIQMNAEKLQFEEESFDFIFSYDAFEHFADPEKVLQEAVRVLKKGGYIFLGFGPLYMSPLGLHANNLINIPYCQLLFPKEVLDNFVRDRNLGILDFGHLNEWSLVDYRTLWDQYSDSLEKIKYNEIHYYADIDMIMKYPSCFKNKTKLFDNMVVSAIEVLFKKIG
jgi:ubiquinone/menaquinone biosynthesis C-methylase UbiE